jgi:hypothetical protein
MNKSIECFTNIYLTILNININLQEIKKYRNENKLISHKKK